MKSNIKQRLCMCDSLLNSIFILFFSSFTLSQAHTAFGQNNFKTVQNSVLVQNSSNISESDGQNNKKLYFGGLFGLCIPSGNAFEEQGAGPEISGFAGLFLSHTFSLEVGYFQSKHSASSSVNDILEHSRIQGFSIGLKRWFPHKNPAIRLFVTGGISFSNVKWSYHERDTDEIDMKAIFFNPGLQYNISKLISIGAGFSLSFSIDHDSIGRNITETEFVYDENNVRVGTRRHTVYDWNTSGSIITMAPSLYISITP